MKILVVEDDPGYREKLKKVLEESAFVVDEVGSAQKAIQYAERYLYSAGLLDLHLPDLEDDKNGIDLMGELRELQRQRWKNASPVPGLEKVFYFPVLFLTRYRDPATELRALEKGANDFISKRDYDPGVLLARLRNIIFSRPASGADNAQIIERGPVKIDLQQMKVYVQEVEVKARITRKEFLMLAFLMSANRVVGKSILIENLWATNYIVDKNKTIDDTNVHQLAATLRKKLDPNKEHNLIVSNQMAGGYSLIGD